MQPLILVPIDFGPASGKALAWAGDLQRSLGGPPVHAIHVLKPVSMAAPEVVVPTISESDIAEVEEELRRAIAAHGIAGTSEVVLSPFPGKAILEVASRVKVNLIAMGTHGRTGLTRAVLGSVAEYVVRHANCPVVTVRAAPVESKSAQAA